MNSNNDGLRPLRLATPRWQEGSRVGVVFTTMLAVVMTLEITVWPRPTVMSERVVEIRRSVPTMAPVNMSSIDKTQAIADLGVGLWLWQVRGRSDPDPVTAGKQLRQLGVGHVLIKAHDGCRPFRRSQRQTAAQYAAYRQSGLKVLAWGYNYANDNTKEAGVIIQQLDDPNVMGYVFNTERDVAGKNKSVEKLLTAVRDHQQGCPKCRGKLLGFAPYAFPYNHASLPHKELLAGCDFVAPQLYWAEFSCTHHDVAKCVDRAQKEWERLMDKLACHRPIIGLGQAFNVVGKPLLSPNPGEIADFAQQCADAGFAGCQYWLWQSVAKTDQRQNEVAQAAKIWPAAKYRQLVTKAERQTSLVDRWLLITCWLIVAFIVAAIWWSIGLLAQSSRITWVFGVVAGLLWPVACAVVMIAGWAIIVWLLCAGIYVFGRWIVRTRQPRHLPPVPEPPATPEPPAVS